MWELLAVKLVLEEWRNWFEGAKHPIQVLIDHINLEYILQDNRLHPHQARLSLFFNQFVYFGYKNIKPNALF